jgi:hypothetical protein
LWGTVFWGCFLGDLVIVFLGFVGLWIVLFFGWLGCLFAVELILVYFFGVGFPFWGWFDMG